METRAMKARRTFSFELDKVMQDFLAQMAEEYSLKDESKALRCLINYARDNPEQLDDIFKRTRCLDC